MSTIKVLVYAMICIQFLLSLIEGSSFYKYVKLFSYLVILYLCCSFVFSMISNTEAYFQNTTQQYDQMDYWWLRWEDY